MHTYTENFSPQNENWMSKGKKKGRKRKHRPESVRLHTIRLLIVQLSSCLGVFDIFHSSVLENKTLSLRWGKHMRFVADVMCHSPSNLKYSHVLLRTSSWITTILYKGEHWAYTKYAMKGKLKFNPKKLKRQSELRLE